MYNDQEYLFIFKNCYKYIPDNKLINFNKNKLSKFNSNINQIIYVNVKLFRKYDIMKCYLIS